MCVVHFLTIVHSIGLANLSSLTAMCSSSVYRRCRVFLYPDLKTLITTPISIHIDTSTVCHVCSDGALFLQPDTFSRACLYSETILHGIVNVAAGPRTVLVLYVSPRLAIRISTCSVTKSIRKCRDPNGVYVQLESQTRCAAAMDAKNIVLWDVSLAVFDSYLSALQQSCAISHSLVHRIRLQSA